MAERGRTAVLTSKDGRRSSLTADEVTAALGLLNFVEEAQAVARRCYWQLKPLALDVETGKPLHEVHDWLLWTEEERQARR